MKPDPGLEPHDLEHARRHGVTEAEILRQLQLLRGARPSIRLDRPCTVGDGVHQIPDGEVAGLLEAQRDAAAAGRMTYFVPASGAASRMFKSLLAIRSRGVERRDQLGSGSDDAIAARFFDGVEKFAFAPALEAVLRPRSVGLAACVRSGDLSALLSAVLDPESLGLPELPKGLLPFHTYRDGSRTAFEEHLVEAHAIAAAADGATRLHLTVSSEHQARFEACLAEAGPGFEDRLGARYGVGFSTQKSSTDTIAVDGQGALFRDDAGALLFRPGGHGSLLSNLADLATDGADVVYVKNIDNVVHDDWRAEVVHWRRLLGGRLVELQKRLFAAVRAIDANAAGAVDAGADLLRTTLGIEVARSTERASDVRRLLDRPTRVCAMLRAEGDPGGGPFWVRASDDSVSAQIVETAQVDQTSSEQRAIQGRATHFSPADMVLGLRRHDDTPFDLHRHVDPEAVFIAEKSSGGRALRALEHPGLWNGGMSDWNTLFVEVPPSIFHPVKTLVDLLEPAHQPAPGLL